MLFAATLSVAQISFAHKASAVGFGWSVGGPYQTRLVGVSSSSDGLIAYATENPTNALKKIWKTIDGGLTWTELENAPSAYWGAIATSGNGQSVVALAQSGIDYLVYRSEDAGVSWSSEHTTTSQLFDIAISADGNTTVVGSLDGILKSIDSGSTYNALVNPLANTQNSGNNDWRSIDMSADGLKIVAVSPGRNIQKSADGGTNWTELTDSGNGHWSDIAISSNGENIMGVTMFDTADVMSSRDGGQTFTSANIGSTFKASQATFAAMSADGMVMIAASYGSHPEMSVDAGITWNSSGLAEMGWMGFAVSDTATPSRRMIAITEGSRVHSYAPIPAPTISSISPESGSTLGGNQVDITGDNFVNVTGVSFGEAAATSFEVLGVSLIRAVAPAHVSGSVNISVTTESGISTSIATYEFLTPLPPTLLSIFPAVGPTAGGSWVDLVGTNLRDIISVTVGGVESAELDVINDDELRFKVPAGVAGTVDVVLTTAGGSATLSNAYNYVVSLDVIEMSWSGMRAQAIDGDVNGEVGTVEQGPNGELYIMGYFLDASGEASADFVARWNGSQWVGLGSGVNGDGLITCEDNCLLFDTAIAQNGDVYIAGRFEVSGLSGVQAIAKWDGATWTSIAADIDGYIEDLVFDNQGTLYASGEFENLGRISTADFIAKWDGTNWSGLGSDGSGDGPLNRQPYAMVVGSDDSLYTSGNFRNAGGVAAADYLAVWNGATWSSVGTYSIDEQEFEPYADSLLIDNSSGADVLYIGGCMDWGSENLIVAKYDGTDWVALAGDFRIGGCVYEMEIAPSGALVIAGEFNSRANLNLYGLAAWTNGQWRPLGNNQDASYYSLEITSDSRVIVGGDFEDLEGSVSADYIAISQPIALLRNVGTSAEITPNIGTELGGTTVTLTGTHFSQATQVKFGTNLATDLTVVSADSISVTTPAHAPGVVDVSIISPSGTQVFPSAFTYFEPVSSVVDTEEEVFLLPEQSITPRNQFVAGDSLTISVPGFVPGEHAQIILASTPQLLASTDADVNGVATATFVFPRDSQGFHTLAIFAPVSARGMRQAIFIHPVGTVLGLGTLPKTGSEIQLWLPFVIAILGFLLITISGNRRRKIA